MGDRGTCCDEALGLRDGSEGFCWSSPHFMLVQNLPEIDCWATYNYFYYPEYSVGVRSNALWVERPLESLSCNSPRELPRLILAIHCQFA